MHTHLTPEKFLIGPKDEEDKLYIVGLSDAQPYLTKSGQHIPWKEDENHANIETNFSSLNTHLGYSKSNLRNITEIRSIS
mgnify:FL=1